MTFAYTHLFQQNSSLAKPVFVSSTPSTRPTTWQITHTGSRIPGGSWQQQVGRQRLRFLLNIFCGPFPVKMMGKLERELGFPDSSYREAHARVTHLWCVKIGCLNVTNLSLASVYLGSIFCTWSVFLLKMADWALQMLKGFSKGKLHTWWDFVVLCIFIEQ